MNIEVGNVGIYSHMDEDTHDEVYRLVVFGEDLGPVISRKEVVKREEKLKNKRNEILKSFIKTILESDFVDVTRNMNEELNKGLWGY
ncbi:MAG: hypothetical protein WCQ65_10690 [Fermentimonas sp.]